MYINLEDNRRHSDPEVEQVEDDAQAFHRLGEHNRLIARERIAEYRERKEMEAELPLWG